MRRFTVSLADRTANDLRELGRLDRRPVRDHIAYVLEQYVARSRRRLETAPGLARTGSRPLADAEREPAAPAA
jgi:hypothetical protein